VPTFPGGGAVSAQSGSRPPGIDRSNIGAPYTEGGVLYDDFTLGFGQDDPDLFGWHASSLMMNPSLGGRLNMVVPPGWFARFWT